MVEDPKFPDIKEVEPLPDSVFPYKIKDKWRENLIGDRVETGLLADIRRKWWIKKYEQRLLDAGLSVGIHEHLIWYELIDWITEESTPEQYTPDVIEALATHPNTRVAEEMGQKVKLSVKEMALIILNSTGFKESGSSSFTLTYGYHDKVVGAQKAFGTTNEEFDQAEKLAINWFSRLAIAEVALTVGEKILRA